MQQRPSSTDINLSIKKLTTRPSDLFLKQYNNNNNNNNITNVEPEMYDYTSYNWSQWNSNENLKEKSGDYTKKTLDRFTTESSYTWNIRHNMKSTAA
jgi:hypothetical protein